MPLFGPPDIRQMEAKRDTQGLIKALAFKDAAIRKAAAEALAPMKDPTAVEPLAGLLKDENPGVRRAAVAALAARGGFRVVEPLVGALQDLDVDVRATAATAVYRRLMTDPDAETRRATAAALGRIRDVEAVSPLAKAITDSDDAVRVAAIKALQAIGSLDAVLPLTIALAQVQVREKLTGKPSPTVERAATQALDALCDETAIDQLEAALRHDDAEVREIAVRRLARIGTPLVAGPLAASLTDEDPVIRRAAARGLAEIGWKPPADEKGAAYWAALREWRRCAECGKAAIPLLVSSFAHVSAPEKGDIVAALAQLKWKPEEGDPIAVPFWAAQGRWDKCVELGDQAIEALDGILSGSPRWRDRVGAAGSLTTLNQPRSAPFEHLDLVQRGLAILDGDGSADDKRGLLEALLVDENLFDPGPQEIEWCKCGYPVARILADELHEPMTEMLGFERSSSAVITYFCPSCDTKQTTAAG